MEGRGPPVAAARCGRVLTGPPSKLSAGAGVDARLEDAEGDGEADDRGAGLAYGAKRFEEELGLGLREPTFFMVKSFRGRRAEVVARAGGRT
ncbi:hypothetical protein GCM10012319_03370 [Comamonas sp. KCTC 72670]|nr:hypothetical protein GCM10012319_03370 [Comamonas sp. KCTC 72670]